jgi:two-component system phosphate regulon sensor histidine kinase PhoR
VKPAWVNADRKRIGEVISNLVANSIKYGHRNGTTCVSFADRNNHRLIAVTDDGIGISERDRLRIFERFYRCDKSRLREQGGTGIATDKDWSVDVLN